MLVRFVNCLSITACRASLSIPNGEEIAGVVLRWLSHVPCLQLISFHALDAQWQGSHPLALEFWVWVSSIRKADASLEPMWKPGRMSGLEILTLGTVCNQGNEMNPNHCIWDQAGMCPSLMVCQAPSFACSRPGMQLSLSSVKNRKFNLLGGKS